MTSKSPLALDERIKKVRADIEAVIDQHVKEIAEGCPGVPAGVIRQTIVGSRCACDAFEALSEAGAL